MRVGVVGAGIIGVTTAYESALLGHEVTVYERRSSVAEEGSFANAGVIAPGYVTPWAAPGMPRKVLRHLFEEHAPVRLVWPGVMRQAPWVWRWWRACRAEVHGRNRAAMHRLAVFSRDRLLELTRTLSLDYDQMPGYMVLLRSRSEVAQAQGGVRQLRELGVPFDLVDAARCRQLEPGLHAGTPLEAGIHLPQDGVGNCRHFAQLLKGRAQQLGVAFRFDTAVHAVQPGSRPTVTTHGGASDVHDAVVICAGVDANALLGKLGCRLPLAPVHGYSITAPLRHHEGAAHSAPRGGLMDERYKVAISRLGQRVRIAGSAELGGKGSRLGARPLATLYRVLDDWFPGAVQTRDVQVWKGARPMLPDGPPVLGPSGAPGVWLNVGHGSSGWALACGSARVSAELVSGRAAPLDLDGLTRARWA